MVQVERDDAVSRQASESHAAASTAGAAARAEAQVRDDFST
jgi:hypothetical protein